jgi:alkanesulfonate monooxygenase
MIKSGEAAWSRDGPTKITNSGRASARFLRRHPFAVVAIFEWEQDNSIRTTCISSKFPCFVYLQINKSITMPTEFISLTSPNASTELNPIPGAPVDPEYLVRYAKALDDYDFNYTLVPYDSSWFDPWTIGATIASATKNIKVIIALRPNTLYPTVAAKALATLDQLSKGRVAVHFIAGGSDAEQAKEGDFLTKEQRYGRLEEYIRILRRAWKSAEPFDWDGQYFQFKQFSNAVRPTSGTIPVSVGGSSPEAYRVGGSLADIFGLWGEPLKETKEQIDKIYAEAEKAGRAPTDRPRIWVTFRPIVAETDDLAWAKAHRTLDALKGNRANGIGKVPAGAPAPQNVGSQRLLEIAARGEVQDRALWYPTVTATNARGASTALVGSFDTVAESILDYVDLGCELISIRGYDNLNDAIDYGRYVLPRVRVGLKGRKSKSQTV